MSWGHPRPYKYRFFGTPPSGANGERKSGDTPETPPGALPLDPASKKPILERHPRLWQEDCAPLLYSQEILYCTDRIDIYFPARGINYAQEWMQVRAANNHLPAVLAAYSLH